jgi:hypothetical protein
LGLLPIMLEVLFAVPWLEPPAEHGAVRLLGFLAQKVVRNVTWVRRPPWRELVEADGLRAFVSVVNAIAGAGSGGGSHPKGASLRASRGAA